jgi:hypothetical protein
MRAGRVPLIDERNRHFCCRSCCEVAPRCSLYPKRSPLTGARVGSSAALELNRQRQYGRVLTEIIKSMGASPAEQVLARIRASCCKPA